MYGLSLGSSIFKYEADPFLQLVRFQYEISNGFKFSRVIQMGTALDNLTRILVQKYINGVYKQKSG